MNELKILWFKIETFQFPIVKAITILLLVLYYNTLLKRTQINAVMLICNRSIIIIIINCICKCIDCE